MTMTTERLTGEEGIRIVPATVHDVDERHVTVDFPHNIIDGYRTTWAPGCFAEFLKRHLPPCASTTTPIS